VGAAEVAMRRAHLDTVRDQCAMEAQGKTFTTFTQSDLDDATAAMERTWAQLTGPDGPSEGVSLEFLCREALIKCGTAQQQRPWLLRALAMGPVAAALKRSMATRCRACGRKGDVAGDGADAPKLRRCGQCALAAYCSPACQKADWPRHKATCAALLAGTAEASMAEALCPSCCSAPATTTPQLLLRPLLRRLLRCLTGASACGAACTWSTCTARWARIAARAARRPRRRWFRTAARAGERVRGRVCVQVRLRSRCSTTFLGPAQPLQSCFAGLALGAAQQLPAAAAAGVAAPEAPVAPPPAAPPPPPPLPPVKECCVCFLDVPLDDMLALMPCLHRCVCEACAAALLATEPPSERLCPKCRKPATGAARVFDN
jgi:hypothetical protein